MKITVIGASGQIGSRVVEVLTAAGHDVVGASKRTGADVLTGEGLADAVAGSAVLVDVTNSPSFEDGPVMDFFSRSSANLVKAAADAGVGHYVALSIVGADGLPDSGYMRAKVVQERTVADSGLPYTIVRATQFHEFAEAIVASLVVGDEIHAPQARIQPVAAADVAATVADAAGGAPANGILDLGGPDKMTFAELARTVLTHRGEHTPVVVDPAATYFGTRVDDDSLVTGVGAVLGDLRFTDWLASR
ncbi:LysR family transcriptional regulator [Mycolicibacterium chubuense]|uniref:NmrA-like family protein n=1 Tax=Mycolicibacterium chubuense TaxID=1800 RepID=A0A0J6WL89_MYCCU|nr:SDR family oxidoreductase [Mycolicibacterium chubuense]KMO84095.1 NmrA-like family protein [Mycolicibacterium chubuense]ORA51950.1 LysR family transcriptional regulator [Mycolicibacterium chubuense]SPX99881.1 dTDP-4-dehydrorhamnose reductase [Mycolicibacterium chubuense]